MVSFWDVLERCSKGQRMQEGDYDTLLYSSVSELVEKYDIKFDPEMLVPADDSLADRAYQAGFELFERVGFYCLDTKRIVRFSRDEIEQRVSLAPDTYTWGEGKDKGVTYNREVEDSRDLRHGSRSRCLVRSGSSLLA